MSLFFQIKVPLEESLADILNKYCIVNILSLTLIDGRKLFADDIY